MILVVYLISLLCVAATVESETTNYGTEFCVAVMKEISHRQFDPLFSPAIIVGTNSLSVVNFTIDYPHEENVVSTQHQIVSNSPYVFPAGVIGPDIFTVDDSFINRNKGTCISSVDKGLYIIYYLRTNEGLTASGSYLALPYQELLTDQYEYYTLSTSSSDSKYYSGFLLVGLRNNTSITIYPSIALNIINDTQNTTSTNIMVLPGENHTVILHRRQTLYIGKDGGADITGTRIVSDEPLTVISGHEAGSVPSHGTTEPMAQQIPPTQLWGNRFMIVPLEHPLAQIIKILSSVDNTAISYNCYQFSNHSISLKAGSIKEFLVPVNVYCYIETNNSVLVGQFPYSPAGNTDGDTTMILIASTDQYSNEFTFSTLNTSSNSEPHMNHYISITVPVEYYSDDSILYDGNPLTAQWRPIYDIDNSTIVGYGCSIHVLTGHHTISHTDSNGKLFVMVYGFSTSRAYGYPAGLQFPPNRVLGVQFSSDKYNIKENGGHVIIEIHRLTHKNYTDTYHFNTTEQPSSRYDPVSQDVVFTPMESSHSVPITIIDNELSEANQTFTIQLQLCHTSSPLTGVCIQSTVTIVDNDVLTIGIKHIEYDAKNGVIYVSVAILNGLVSPGYKVFVSLNTTLVFASNYTFNPVDLNLHSKHIIDATSYSLKNVFSVYPMKSLQAIISELTVTDTKVLVTVVPAICQLDDLIVGQITCYSPGNSTSTNSITSTSTPTITPSIHASSHGDIVTVVTSINTTMITSTNTPTITPSIHASSHGDIVTVVTSINTTMITSTNTPTITPSIHASSHNNIVTVVTSINTTMITSTSTMIINISTTTANDIITTSSYSNTVVPPSINPITTKTVTTLTPSSSSVITTSSFVSVSPVPVIATDHTLFISLGVVVPIMIIIVIILVIVMCIIYWRRRKNPSSRSPSRSSNNSGTHGEGENNDEDALIDEVEMMSQPLQHSSEDTNL